MVDLTNGASTIFLVPKKNFDLKGNFLLGLTKILNSTKNIYNATKSIKAIPNVKGLSVGSIKKFE